MLNRILKQLKAAANTGEAGKNGMSPGVLDVLQNLHVEVSQLLQDNGLHAAKIHYSCLEFSGTEVPILFLLTSST